MSTVTDDSIVIVPAVTCPADFPAKVAAFKLKVDDLAPRIKDLAKRIADDLLDVLDEVNAPEAHEAALVTFDEVTGWGELCGDLADLAGWLLCAANMGSEQSEPDWWKDRTVRRWLAEVADPATSEARVAEVSHWLGRNEAAVARVQGQ